MTPELIVVVQYYQQLIDDIFIIKQFLLTYLGTAPQDMKPEQGQQHMKDYRQWWCAIRLCDHSYHSTGGQRYTHGFCR